MILVCSSELYQSRIVGFLSYAMLSEISYLTLDTTGLCACRMHSWDTGDISRLGHYSDAAPPSQVSQNIPCSQ